MRILIILFKVGEHIYFIYLFIFLLCIAHPICLCVWRWSDNWLSGSRCCDRWARRCL